MSTALILQYARIMKLDGGEGSGVKGHTTEAKVPDSRSKLLRLGFHAVDTRTGERLSPLFAKRDKAREVAMQHARAGNEHTGVHTLEVHVPANWTKSDPLDKYLALHEKSAWADKG
jgi:hypothetical protein